MSPKVAVVTGGTGGLGGAVVSALLRDGWSVSVPGRAHRTEAWAAVPEGDVARLRLHRAELLEPASVERFFAEVREEHGRLHLLCNLVGSFAAGPLTETSPGTWRSLWETNVTTAFLATRAAVPLLSTAGDARVVLVAAAAALSGPLPDMAAYLAAKTALLSLTRNLARELGPAGIRVNAVAPTILDTPANREGMPDADRSTWLTPEEVAGVIRFLAGPDAGVVTGSVLELRKYAG